MATVDGKSSKSDRKRVSAGGNRQLSDFWTVKKKKLTENTQAAELNPSPVPEQQSSVSAAEEPGPIHDILETPVPTGTYISHIIVSECDTDTASTDDLHSSSQLYTDIGDLFVSCRSDVNAFVKAISELSSAQKYHLLKNHRKSKELRTFPATFIGGCNRSFQPKWLINHPTMVYSEAVDGIFCLVCTLFSCDKSKGKLVTQPFSVWNKQGDKLESHKHLQYHQGACKKADLLVQYIEKPQRTISALVSNQRKDNIEKNRAILKSIAAAILFCGRQCIALRGDSEKLNEPGNPGNFLALLKLLSIHDQNLQAHLESPAMRCATYISPHTQNEMIEVIGKRIILKGIVEDLNDTPFHSILADEVTSHNVEHLSIYVRFVDSDRNIRKEFLAFLKLELGKRLQKPFFNSCRKMIFLRKICIDKGMMAQVTWHLSEWEFKG